MFRISLLFFGSFTIYLAIAIESNFYREEPCGQAKGYCVLSEECHYNVTAEDGKLCKNQKSAVCCRNFPDEQVNCFQTNNECMEICPEILNQGSKGCPKGKVCCTLV